MRRLSQLDAIRSRSSCPLSRFLWILKIDFQSGPFYVARRRRCNRNGGSLHETKWRLQFRLPSTAARIPISCCLMALLNVSARDAPASKSPRGEMARCLRQRAKIVESPSLRKSAPISIARSVTTMFEAIDSSRWRRLQTRVDRIYLHPRTRTLTGITSRFQVQGRLLQTFRVAHRY